MKAMFADRALYDDSKFEDTEIALAISPCPKIEEPRDTGWKIELARRRSGIDRRHAHKGTDKNELTETATIIEIQAIAWAIASAALAVVAIYVFGAN